MSGAMTKEMAKAELMKMPPLVSEEISSEPEQSDTSASDQLRVELVAATVLLVEAGNVLALVEYADNSENEYRALCPACGRSSTERHRADCQLEKTYKAIITFKELHK